MKKQKIIKEIETGQIHHCPKSPYYPCTPKNVEKITHYKIIRYIPVSLYQKSCTKCGKKK